MNNFWYQKQKPISSLAALSGGAGGMMYITDASLPYTGDRGVWAGGNTSSQTNYIQYKSLTGAQSGSTSNFGDLTESADNMQSTSGDGRGVRAGGRLSGGGKSDVMDYITFANTGNATDFGDLSDTWRYSNCDTRSDGTRGIWACGNYGSTEYSDRIDYITIATTGDSSDFGNLHNANKRYLGGASNKTRAIHFGGVNSGGVSENGIEYITIQTTGNGADFGDLTGTASLCGGSGGGNYSDRGLRFGGNNGINVIDYVTITTTGNATDFGDMTESIYICSGCAALTTNRVVNGGGRKSNLAQYGKTQYVDSATTGDATEGFEFFDNVQGTIAYSG